MRICVLSILLIELASGQITFSGKGEVVAIRYLELKDNVSIEDFEKFAIDEYNPNFNRVIPGLKVYIAKSDRGIAINSYSLIMEFDSQVVRNTMIPEQKSSDWLNAIFEERDLWTLWNKINEYVTEESMDNYNDFIELR